MLALAVSGAPQSDPPRVAIDGAEIGIMSEASLAAVAEEAAKVAQREGIEPEQMSISLVWIDRGASVYGIRIRIETDKASVVDPDDPRGPVMQKCEACAEPELVTASVEGVLEAVKRYKELTAPPPKPEPAVVPKQVPPPAEKPAPVDKQGLGPLGKAGVASIVVGGTGVIAGAVLVALGTRRPSADPTKLREFRPSGYVSLGVGGIVLATGIALLAVDRRRAKKSRASVTPQLGPGFAGVQGRCRF